MDAAKQKDLEEKAKKIHEMADLALHRSKEHLKCERSKIVFTQTIGSLDWIEFEGIEKVAGSIFIECIPAVCLAASIAAAQIIDILSLPLVGVVRTRALEPHAFIVGGQPSYAIRLYGNDRVSILVCELEIDDQLAHDLVEAVIQFAYRKSIKTVVSFEGIPKEDEDEDEDDEDEEEEEAGGWRDADDEEDEKPKARVVVNRGERSGVVRITGPSEKKVDDDAPTGDGKATSDEFVDVIDRSIARAAKVSGVSDGLAAARKKSKTASFKDKAASPKAADAKAKAKPKTKEEREAEKKEKDNVVRKAFYVTLNADEARTKLDATGHLPAADGQVSGVTGGLLAEFALRDIPYVALFAPMSGVFADANSAIGCIDALNDAFEMTISTERLTSRSSKLSESISALLATLESAKQQRSKPPPGMFM